MLIHHIIVWVKKHESHTHFGNCEVSVGHDGFIEVVIGVDGGLGADTGK